jgi:hypothetical protein
MRSSKNKTREVSFGLRPDHLQRIISEVRKVSPALKFDVQCGDGSTLIPTTLEELISLPNPSNREIISISIESPYSAEARVEIDLKDDDEYGRTISYSVSGDDSVVVALSSHIDSWIETISTRSVFTIIPAMLRQMIFVLLTSVLCIPFILGGVELNHHDPFGWVWLAIGVIALFGMLMAGRARRYLFHMGEFEIGDGAGRAAKRRNLRGNLFWRVLIGFIISIAFLFFGIYVKKHLGG